MKRAACPSKRKEYVVKCFDVFDSSKRRMLREEMKLLMMMDCPSIVTFHGAFLDQDHKVRWSAVRLR